jgi:hypothetical protein
MALPKPEPGLVINYAYLWHDEHRAGYEEGRKYRPSVVVLTTQISATETRVLALPITHRAPDNAEDAIEIPSRVKQHLKLDAERSWIIISEGNAFVWPGHDMKQVPAGSRYEYGYLPPNFFSKLRAEFVANAALRRTRISTRT